MDKNLKYLKEVNAQKQIDKLSQKYKDKKVVIYGAGLYFRVLKENFNLSGLNIVAICDKKFEASKTGNPSEYLPIVPDELKTFDYDVILSALYDDTSLCEYLEYDLLINTPNEGKEIRSIVEPTFWYALKVLLGLKNE